MKRNVWFTVHGEQQYEGMTPDSAEQHLPGTIEETAEGLRLRYEEPGADARPRLSRALIFRKTARCSRVLAR